MNNRRFCFALFTSMLVTVAWAQTPSKPLNLKLPAAELPANNATVSPPPSSAPGVYYGDTSGRIGNTEVVADDHDDCDDSSYNQPQVHGSVGMGVIGGNHVRGNYQTGSVNLSKAFGSCNEPRGGLSISVETGQFDSHRRH